MEGKFQNALTADSRCGSVDGRKRYENDSVDADQLVFGKTNPYTFESALVWTSP